MSATTSQRLDALDRANHVRISRSHLKRQIRIGDLTIDDVLLDPPDYIHTMTIYDFLTIAPRVGRSKTLARLNRLRISPARQVGQITDRERHLLLGIR